MQPNGLTPRMIVCAAASVTACLSAAGLSLDDYIWVGRLWRRSHCAFAEAARPLGRSCWAPRSAAAACSHVCTVPTQSCSWGREPCCGACRRPLRCTWTSSTCSSISCSCWAARSATEGVPEHHRCHLGRRTPGSMRSWAELRFRRSHAALKHVRSATSCTRIAAAKEDRTGCCDIATMVQALLSIPQSGVCAASAAWVCQPRELTSRDVSTICYVSASRRLASSAIASAVLGSLSAVRRPAHCTLRIHEITQACSKFAEPVLRNAWIPQMTARMSFRKKIDRRMSGRVTEVYKCA